MGVETDRGVAIADDRSKPTLLVSWIRWYGWAVFAIGCFFFVLFYFRRSPASLIFAVGLSLFAFPALRYGLWSAERNRTTPALVIVTLVCWVFALIGAARGTIALPAVFPLLLLPVILSLPYVSPRSLLKIAFVALVVCAAASGLTLHGSFLPSRLQEVTLSLVMQPIIITTTALALFGLWHVGTRLRRSLTETEAMNQALAESERSLERKVTERTAELRGALDEISAIQEISRTVTATLDLDRVLSTIVSALQRVFSFDVLTVLLLDEEGKNLFIDRIVGLDLDSEPLKSLKHQPIPMTADRSILVAAVHTGKARWASDLGPHRTADMAPIDRQLFDVFPIQSLLVCPLEIKGEPIGVITFANTQESVVPSEAERERIQRYVTPLSAAIRNARLYEEAESARAEALESSRAKSQFLANMSHELRTPLNAIIGYSEMLMEEAEDEGFEDMLPDLERIRASGHFLLELINGVLDLTKIEAGKMEVRPEDFEVSEVLSEILTTARPLAQKNDNRFEVEGLESVGRMYSDPIKIRQIILNLLSNASKFTEQGSIRFEAERTTDDGRDWIAFRVSDTGVGMAPDQIERVFEAFTQADESTSRKYGGTGLGLTITCEFCAMLGGSIGVESEPDTGSTFTVHLPADVRAPLEPPPAG